MMDNTPKYTAAEVAKKLGVSDDVVFKWARSKQMNKVASNGTTKYMFSEFRWKQIENDFRNRPKGESIYASMKRLRAKSPKVRYKISFGKVTKEKPRHEE